MLHHETYAELEVARRRASSASRSAKLMLDSSLSLLPFLLLPCSVAWGLAWTPEPLEPPDELGAAGDC